jgi:hypothetical protein
VQIQDWLETRDYLTLIDDSADRSLPPIALPMERVISCREFKPIQGGSCYLEAQKDFATDWKTSGSCSSVAHASVAHATHDAEDQKASGQ